VSRVRSVEKQAVAPADDAARTGIGHRGAGSPRTDDVTPSAPSMPEVRTLAKRVRATKALTGQQKRYWLAVLPHLRPEDRDRLDAILRGVAGTDD
jgi:hypothetical protein